MSIDRSVLAVAVFTVLIPVVLTAFASPYFVWPAAFVGLSLLQSVFTGFCPTARAFKVVGVKPGCAFQSEGRPSCASSSR